MHSPSQSSDDASRHRSQDGSVCLSLSDVSKRYLLGGGASSTLNEWVARWKPRGRQNGESGEFWALRDINLEVKRGEVFGLIGSNGAGKSTLLKLISRIMAPTTGRIDIYGRVASLLEVGTGFHPDLSGRENIYMNGTLLGMKRREVDRRFEQIVDFAGVGRFLETPVKRYSSGMRVRLGFAVAAHLEPEVLVVDEVLTVGDAEFQQRCLGKMKSVAKSGRTVVFVSHNMAAVRSLCTTACLLEKGRMSVTGNVSDVVMHYLKGINADVDGNQYQWPMDAKISLGDESYLIPEKVWVCDPSGRSLSTFTTEQSIEIRFQYRSSAVLSNVRIGVAVSNHDDVLMFGSNTQLLDSRSHDKHVSRVTSCRIPARVLNRGTYTVDLGADLATSAAGAFEQPNCIRFRVVDLEGSGITSEPLPGVIRPHLQWNTFSVDSAPQPSEES